VSSRILIVEDDRNFASQVKEIVDKHGHTAVVAVTGPEGVEMFERHAPDVLLVDVMLPGITGIQVVEQVRALEKGADVPIFLMSAMYRSADFFRADMERLHLLDFLPKPFSLIDFGRRIDQLVAEPEKGRAKVREMSGEHQPPKSAPAGKPEPKPSAEPPATQEESPKAAAAAAAKETGRASHPRTTGQPNVSRNDGKPFETDALTPDRYVQMISTLFHSHSSGSFDLLGIGTRHTIHFLNGYAVWVDVPDIVDGLPRHLVEESLISLSQMGKLAEIATSRDGDLRGALGEMKVIAEEEIGPVLERWIAHELRQGLEHRGRARFERSDGFSQQIQIEEVNPIQALWKGVYRIPDDEWFEGALSELDGRPVGKTRSFPRLFGYLGRDPRLRSVAEAIREPKTAEEFLDRMAEDRGLGTRSLWFLMYSGLVSFAEPHPGKSTGPKSRASSKRATAAKAKAKAKAAAKPQVAAKPKPAAAKPSPEPRVEATPEATAEPTPTPTPKRKAAPKPAPEPSPEPVAEARPEPPPEPSPEAQPEPAVESATKPAEQHVHFEPTPKRIVKKPAPVDDRSPIEIVRVDHLEKMGLNHYGFLEIEQDATSSEVEEAYNRLAPAYRPRNLGSDAPDDAKNAARELLARLVSAYEELSDAKRRARYDLSDASRKPGRRGEVGDSSYDDESGGRMSATTGAEPDDGPWYPGQHDPGEIDTRAEDLDEEDADTLRVAHAAIKRGEYKKAFSALDELRALDPSNSFVLADLGWCRFAEQPDNERELEKALEWVDLALAFDPSHRNALEVKARILTRLGDPDKGTDIVLRNLLKVVPKHRWAEQQLKIQEGLKAAAENADKGGGLRGILGRKK